MPKSSSGSFPAKGYPAYKVSVSQKAGTLWRVRVGNYATRDEAVAFRVRLCSTATRASSSSATIPRRRRLVNA